MWGGSCWQPKPPFLTKQYVVYGTTDPGGSPQLLLGEVLILVQIMGIIHYLFIAGQEDEKDYHPVAQKMQCDILWLYGMWMIGLPKYQ